MSKLPQPRIFGSSIGIAAALSLSACYTPISFETSETVASEEELAPPDYEGRVEFVDESLLTDQIESSDQEIVQIEPVDPTAASRLSGIDVADPCFGAKQRNEACSSVEVPLSEIEQQASVPAEIRLNSIGSGITDPREFDADKTVDEIGRGQALSETARAVGESFLSPTETPIEPEQELETPTHPGAAAVTYLNQ